MNSMDDLRHTETSQGGKVRGIAASPGVAVGRAFVFGDILDEVEVKAIDASEVDREIERFLSAVELVRDELKRDAERISEQLGKEEADVFLVHSMILEDRTVLDAVTDRIRENLVSAEAALAEEAKRLAQGLASSSDAYLRDRAYDITDIGKRVIERMLGVWAHCPLTHPMVVVSRELRASDTAMMDRGRILGFVTEFGGRDTHAAILARSLGVPSVVGVQGVLDRVKTGDTLVVDGGAGVVIIDPTDEVVERYERKRKERARAREELSELIAVPSETADGVRIALMANIGSADEAREAARLGAEGVGLFRTEMIFMAAKLFLSEDEQYETYRAVAEIMDGKPVTIRTLDIGGDKFVGPENPYNEHNPYLGYRSIRVMLDRPQLFLTQMRAILRAGAHGDVRMLWPMISSVEELRAAKAKLEEAKDGLRREGARFDEDMAAGVMIEIPSAALVADRLALESDFLSIGTNDLVQYTLAVDRGNVYVEHLYRPHDPAVVALIARTVEGAAAAGKPVSLCGEMGGLPCYVPLLIGLGLRELSVAPGRMLSAKMALRETTAAAAAELARRAVAATTAGDVEAIIGWEASCGAERL